jgi:hypothetical protein
MRLVIVGNRLHRRGPQSKEVADRQIYAGVRWRENFRRTNRSILGNGLPFQDAAFKKKPQTDHPQGTKDDEQRGHSAMRMSAVSDYFHTATTI